MGEKGLTVEVQVQGKTVEDVVDALERFSKLIYDGYTSGGVQNASYVVGSFRVDGEPVKEPVP